MKNKRGFTLVEVIISIALIIGIGVGSVFGIRQIQNNILVNELSKITDKILAAAEVYIETDKKTHDQIYNKKNAAVIPLKTLVDEGLVDLSLTTLEEDDIENQYILSAFTSKPGAPEGCVEITNTPSWTMSSSAPIYICANGTGGSGGSGNLTITTNGSNYERVTENDEYSFVKSTDQNFIKYKENVYRIMKIEKDDSLILVSKNSFGNTFNGVTENIDYWPRTPMSQCTSNKSSWDGDYMTVTRTSSSSEVGVTMKKQKEVSDSEVLLSLKDLDQNIAYNIQLVWSLIGYSIQTSVGNGIMGYTDHCGYYSNSGYKIHLKNCMKITSRGTGTETNPYILENYC